MKDVNAPPEGISEFGCPPIPKSFSTPVPQAQSKNLLSKPSKDFCVSDMSPPELSVTLDPVSISEDRDLSHYWNELCRENQSIWWLPHQTVSRGPDSRLSGISSNFREFGSSFWKKTISPSNSTSNSSLRISDASKSESTNLNKKRGAIEHDHFNLWNQRRGG